MLLYMKISYHVVVSLGKMQLIKAFENAGWLTKKDANFIKKMKSETYGILITRALHWNGSVTPLIRT